MDFECSICLTNDKLNIAILNCKHKFHQKCIKKWLSYSLKLNKNVNKYINKCPLCLQGDRIIYTTNDTACKCILL